MSNTFTPPALAKHWGVSPEKIHAFIRAGELRAINLATRLSGRPRYVIDRADVAAFEKAREVAPMPRAERRKRKLTDYVEYY
jgi:hypothetical protein